MNQIKKEPIPSTEKEKDEGNATYFTGSLWIFESSQNACDYYLKYKEN